MLASSCEMAKSRDIEMSLCCEISIGFCPRTCTVASLSSSSFDAETKAPV
jgi:hypothetical protein